MMTKKERHDRDLIEYGCGYWSVCVEHGACCPCSSDSKVMQGFSEETWDNIKKEDIEQMDYL